jgi:hypothetical protein
LWATNAAVEHLFQTSVAEAEHADFANGKENRDTNQPVHCCANRWFQKERDTFDPLYSVSQDQRCLFEKRRPPMLQALQ